LILKVYCPSFREGLIEVDSALKKTFTDGMTTILQEMANLQQTIADQQTLISRLTEQHTSLREELTSHRHETIRKIEDISLKTPPPTTTSFPQSFQSQLSTLKSLKRDLTTLKSEHNALITSTQSSITSLRNLPFSDTVKIVNSDSLASQKSDLEQKTQSLVTLSDDLSDQVDDLRIDITQKRIRPHPRQITSVRKQEASVQKQLESVEALLKTLRPMWKKKWEEELQQVIDGQEFLRHQETLITDLRKDLADTQNVMAQIVQAAELFETAQPREWLSGGIGSGGRDAVLGEVKTVQPNSAERVEAIKRAEKARQRDLELRRESEFQLELGEVVNESKLRNLGESALRIEREREEKEKQLRQQMWENEKDKERLKTNGRSLEEKDKEKVVGGANVKRAVSEGSSSLAEANSAKTESDDGVTRSQSYTSGLLSRMMRVGSATAKRWSGGELAKKASIHEDQVEDTMEDDGAGVGRNTDDG
jgi:Actin interacting protein 3